MTTYTALLKITATTAWDTWYECSCTATAATETALDIAWEIAKLAYIVGRWALAATQEWVDRTVVEAAAPVEDELPQLPELLEEAAALVAKPVPAMAAPMTQPAVIAVVEVATEPDNYASLNSAQLRKRCRDAGIAWRNVHGKGKHLRKGEMLEALGA